MPVFDKIPTSTIALFQPRAIALNQLATQINRSDRKLESIEPREAVV
ncbi:MULTISPECIES: hypothetical protein [unclassified Microcoleus]